MVKKNKKLRYIAYIRKSEERKERQELSHEGQIREIKTRFPDLNIIEWMEPESKSAFTPGRPIFNRMMDKIEAGDADGIVAYFPNRLSRNEIDSARITFDLRGPLKDLKFCTFNFENSPEGIWMLQNIMNQGQYESSKQGREVKRGMKVKASDGERPGQVALGYMKVPVLDDIGQLIKRKDKIITKTANDPERFDMVKRMWQMFLYEGYTAGQIRKIASEEWKFTTRKTKKGGGEAMGINTIYRIFNNQFYAGWLYHKGEYHKGKHEAMITLEEFDYAQKLLGTKGLPRSGTVDYAFGGMITCGECGCSVVAKVTPKLIKSTGEIKKYVHYYCTRKSLKRPCTQHKYTSVEKLEEEINEELGKYTILPEFRAMALKIIHRNHKGEVKDRTAIYGSQQKRRNEVQSQIDKLTDRLSRDVIEEEDYIRQRNRLKMQLAEIDDNLRHTEKRAEDWLELSERAFDFATYARIRFNESRDLRVKRNILKTLGQNLTLKDNKLSLTPYKWLVPIAADYPSLEKAYLRARTNKKATAKELEATLMTIFESWRAQWDLNPRHPA